MDITLYELCNSCITDVKGAAMLEFYIGKENLPKDIPFIYDVESAFPFVIIRGSDFQKRVISEIDNGSYNNNKTFIDRFGLPLRYDCLSTGSKAILLLDSKKDAIINMTECGDNVLGLLEYIEDGKLFFSDRSFEIPFNKDYGVVCNGKRLKGVSQINYWYR